MRKSEIDLFLSYNSKDRLAVQRLAVALRNRGLRPWVDFNDLPPGKPWQDEIEEVIQGARAAAILVGGDGLGPWEVPEMRACLTQLVKRRVPVIPILIPGAPRELELPVFLGELTWIDLRDGISDQGIDKIIWGATGRRSYQESSSNHIFLEPTISCSRCGRQVATGRASADGTCPECQKALKWYEVPIKWPVKWPLTPRAKILASFIIWVLSIEISILLMPEIGLSDGAVIGYVFWALYWGTPAILKRVRRPFSPWLIFLPLSCLIVPLALFLAAWFYSLFGGGLYEFVRFCLRNRATFLSPNQPPAPDV